MKTTTPGTVVGPGKPKVGLLPRVLLGARTREEARTALTGYAYVTPWILGLLLFFGGPIIASLVLSFCKYQLGHPIEYVGLENYRQAFRGDSLFWPSLRRTFNYAAIYVPIVVVGSLLLAMLVNQRLAGTNFFRTLFFLPHLTPSVALGVLWVWFLHTRMGPVALLLRKLGLPNPGFLWSRTWAMPSIVMISLWAGLGGNRMLIFLAGLQGLPQDLYEAAQMDGAGTWAKFRHVTLPLLSPVIYLNAILAVIGSLQVFTVAFVATEGGPNYATYFYALHIYNQAFVYFRLGYGCTLAWVLAAIIIVLTYIQIKLSGRWVFYYGAA